MSTLGETVSLLRSKNAGPFYLTFDLMFPDRRTYDRAVQSPALTAENIAKIYGIPVEDVEVYHYHPANAIKITIPRKIPSCDVGDTDTHGGQQFAPLVDLEL